MDGVTVVTHPLVQHKLTLMRDKETSTRGFRQLLREIATLLCYEVTRDLTLTTKRIETPLTDDGCADPRRQEAGLRLDPALRQRPPRRAARSRALGPRRPHRPLSRSRDAAAGRVLFQGAGRSLRAPGDRRRPDAGDRQLGRGGGRSASRSAAPRTFASSACSPRRRESPDSGAATPTCRSSPPPSTAISTTTATSFPASATPATACTGRSKSLDLHETFGNRGRRLRRGPRRRSATLRRCWWPSFPIGMLFGALAVGKGLSVAEAGLMSLLVFAGGAQFAALELWAYPVPVFRARRFGVPRQRAPRSLGHFAQPEAHGILLRAAAPRLLLPDG